jgi:hypothetical protein
VFKIPTHQVWGPRTPGRARMPGPLDSKSTLVILLSRYHRPTPFADRLGAMAKLSDGKSGDKSWKGHCVGSALNIPVHTSRHGLANEM